MRIVAIINQKGGCGKTTTAINLAGMFAKQGYRTLLVDMDPQSHCAAGLAIPEQRIDLDIGDAMLAPAEQPIDPQRLLWRASRNLDLAPSRTRLAGLESARGGLADKPDKERRLSNALSRLARNYDICFIDCSPSIGLLTFNALAAATEILIPVETSFFSLQGATKQVNTIRSLSKKLGSQAPYWLVATIHDESSVLARDLLEELRRRFARHVAPQVIRRDTTLKEAASFGQPVVEYSPQSPGAQDYAALAAWLIENISVHAASRPRIPELADYGPEERLAPGDSSAGTLAHVEPKPLQSGRAGEIELRPEGITDSGEISFDQPQPDMPVPLQEPTADGLSVSRAEEMAQRARVLLLKRADEDLKRVVDGNGASSMDSPQPANGLHPESMGTATAIADRPRSSSASKVAMLYGARQTRTGVLFVQPLSLGHRIAVAGGFNQWTPIPLKRNEELGVWELCIPVPPGRQLYRLVIDGVWRTDPNNPERQANPFGEHNSVIEVPAPATTRII